MRRILCFTIIISSFFILFVTNSSFAFVTTQSSGTLTVDWNQNGDAFIWELNTNTGTYPVFGMNGADAIRDTENYTELEGGGREYNSIVSDYNGGWVNSLDDVERSSTANNGGDIVGYASTTGNSVHSSADVANNNTGVILNASGTSHLVRNFKVSTSGTYNFDVDYLFSDSYFMDDMSTEWADWYHHGSLILSAFTTSWTKIQELVITSGDINYPTTGEGSLSIFSDFATDTQYSIEMHTYNSASAYSPAPVPEPATMLLLGLGLVGFAGVVRRKYKK
ncbi:MAG: PEP-CTERM sorting domain-containing protein [Desulfobacterales bacterium]|nr:PEP-CTERM sorting domain-containing protein [Desulfobacterales bacterium]